MRSLEWIGVLVFLAFLIIGVGCNAGQPELSEEKQKAESEPFSFAVITDLTN